MPVEQQVDGRESGRFSASGAGYPEIVLQRLCESAVRNCPSYPAYTARGDSRTRKSRCLQERHPKSGASRIATADDRSIPSFELEASATPDANLANGMPVRLPALAHSSGSARTWVRPMAQFCGASLSRDVVLRARYRSRQRATALQENNQLFKAVYPARMGIRTVRRAFRQLFGLETNTKIDTDISA